VLRFVGLILFSIALALSVRAERLPVKAYTTADGLAHNEINKIVRDSRGFLWFCTSEGLSLFDGYRFTNFRTIEGLPHAVVTDIVETRDGDYWVATFGGLVRFNPKGTPANSKSNHEDKGAMFTTLIPGGNDRLTQAFTVLLKGRDGTVWAGTRKGLFRVAQENGRVELQSVDITSPKASLGQSLISALLEDRHGTLWVGANTGLYRLWADGTGARYGSKDGLKSEHINDLLEDKHGDLWVGTPFSGLLRLITFGSRNAPVVKQIYDRKSGLPSDWVFDLYEAADGKLWVGTNLGLAEFAARDDRHAGPSHVFSKRHGLIFHEISQISEDRDGNLWLGTAAGAMKLARNGFITFGEGDSILTGFPFFESEAGEIYFRGLILGDERRSVFEGARLDINRSEAVGYWLGIGRFDGERFHWLIPNAVRNKKDVSWNDKDYTLRTRTGEWWIGRFRFAPVGSFEELKTARPVEYTLKDGLASLGVIALFEDSRGDVWISTFENGLARWEHTTRTLQNMSSAVGLSPFKDKLALAFEEDRAGNVWISFEGSGGGLARYTGGSFQSFTADDGLPQSSMSDLYLDHTGRLWVATTRGGLVRVDSPAANRPAFAMYTIDKGLSSNNLNVVTEDLYGRIYVGTGRGVDRLVPDTERVEHFTSDDGLAAGEIRGAFRERSGAIWFSARSGFSRFVPEPERPSLTPPILITNLTVAGERQNVSAVGETEIALSELAPNENQLQIDFVGLSYAPGEMLRYQYRLEGADKSWSTPGDQRTVNYARLAPGRYRFLVRAVNSYGVVSPTPSAITFTILPPVWQRWWFNVLVVIAIGLIVYSLYRYRVARLLELANIRTRIATDLHDDIGANLTRISMLSEVARQQYGNGHAQADNPLQSIARIARESVASMSDIVWAINPERDNLRDVVRKMRRHAEEVFSLRDVELHFDAPSAKESQKLGVTMRRDLLLIFKEAVNNVARHSDCSRVDIELRIEGSQVFLTIVDDGVGFDTSVVSEGHGVQSMKRRAQMLGGMLEIVSAPGQTKVSARIPLSQARRISSLHPTSKSR
jgi:ligand-binding sensor domain-containing protein/two-component sensor histidine kinase